MKGKVKAIVKRAKRNKRLTLYQRQNLAHELKSHRKLPGPMGKFRPGRGVELHRVRTRTRAIPNSQLPGVPQHRSVKRK